MNNRKTKVMIIDTPFTFRNIPVNHGVYDYSDSRMKIGRLWYMIGDQDEDGFWAPDIDNSVIAEHGHIETINRIKVKDHYVFDDGAELFPGALYLYIENGIGQSPIVLADDREWHVGFDKNMIQTKQI